ncbi:hypothetical protein F406_gp066 [Agrobacterium phage 7-7-1]|uniref:Uncharacterized protein n=1 Tax=Agrobacterium phage 7-7-1 TaxID=1161931 RepID=J7FA65_9CAUD|nr:hypothetical protein F406_gp066 [Agrobacterium phage 7-7-1]AFH19749.1 hypothetical protein 7-7-1_00051 [Agrobacterium phage 7-7-1]
MMKVHKSELVPQGRLSFSTFEESFPYPEIMKWSFSLPLLWQGKSEFEQVYRDLAAVRRFRRFLRPVAAPVSDLWTSATYPMGVPVEHSFRPVAVIDGKFLDIESDFYRGYYTGDIRSHLSFREFLLRKSLNETYGSLYRGR